MAIDIRPEDYGLNQDFQAAQSLTGANPIDYALRGITVAPGAIGGAMNRQALANQVGGGYLPNNPYDALIYQHLKETNALDQPVSDDIMNSAIGKQMYPQRDPNAANPTMREFMGMAKQYRQTSKTDQSSVTTGGPNITMGLKGDQFEQQQWNQINRMTNPAVAPRGSMLGIAGQANARAQRGFATLNDPHVSPQQINAVVTDLAAIMQGGAPHEVSIKQQAYGNIWNDIANLKTRLTGSPSDANQPDVINKLRQVMGDIVSVDNKVISDNLDTAEAGVASWMAANRPQKWANYKSKVLGPLSVGMKTEPASGSTAPTRQDLINAVKSGQMTPAEAKMRARQMGTQ